MVTKNNKIKTIKNTFLIKIEGKKYFIHESYIVSGSGFSFAIYKTSKFIQRRNNCCIIGHYYERIVVFGKKYNYMLIKKKIDLEKEIYFEFDVVRYEKSELKIISSSNQFDNFYTIHLNDEQISSFYTKNNFLKKEATLYNSYVRKEKLKKING